MKHLRGKDPNERNELTHRSQNYGNWTFEIQTVELEHNEGCKKMIKDAEKIIRELIL